jgi:dipeptide transport system ATP-binding protein
MSVVVEGRNLIRDYHVPGSLMRAAKTVRAVNSISFSVSRGKTLAIVGESGSGKSTLARIVALIDPATGGELLIEGKPVDIARQKLTREMRSKVQMVFQNPYGSLNPRQKIGDVLMEPLALNTGRTARPGARDAGQGRPAGRAFQPLSAYVLGRAAPAHRDRARLDAEPDAAGAG